LVWHVVVLFVYIRYSRMRVNEQRSKKLNKSNAISIARFNIVVTVTRVCAVFFVNTFQFAPEQYQRAEWDFLRHWKRKFVDDLRRQELASVMQRIVACFRWYSPDGARRRLVERQYGTMDAESLVDAVSSGSVVVGATTSRWWRHQQQPDDGSHQAKGRRHSDRRVRLSAAALCGNGHAQLTTPSWRCSLFSICPTNRVFVIIIWANNVHNKLSKAFVKAEQNRDNILNIGNVISNCLLGNVTCSFLFARSC